MTTTYEHDEADAWDRAQTDAEEFLCRSEPPCLDDEPATASEAALAFGEACHAIGQAIDAVDHAASLYRDSDDVLALARLLSLSLAAARLHQASKVMD